MERKRKIDCNTQHISMFYCFTAIILHCLLNEKIILPSGLFACPVVPWLYLPWWVWLVKSQGQLVSMSASLLLGGEDLLKFMHFEVVSVL